MVVKLLGRRERLFVEVRKAIEEYILEQELQPGDRLPSEPELCEMFGVSRTATREAMKLLEAFGVVSIEPGRGTFIKQVSPAEILEQLPLNLAFRNKDFAEVAEVRLVLEQYCVEQAASMIAEEQLGRNGRGTQAADLLGELEQCLARMKEKAESGQRFFEDDVRFHRAITEYVDNRVLLLVLEVFWSLRQRVPEEEKSISELLDRYERHRELYEVLKAGDGERAKAALQAHGIGTG